MFNVRLAGDNLFWKWLFDLAVAGDAFDGILICVVLFVMRCLG